MRVWLVSECDEEMHRVLAAFSDRARASAFKGTIEEHHKGRSWITIESHEVDPPREKLPGMYASWTHPELPDVEYILDRWEGDGLTMDDGSGRGHGATPEEATANARKYAAVQREEPE